MTKYNNCISCDRPHKWTEDKNKSVGKGSFFRAVCENCLEKLRKNEFTDDWSLSMSIRFENQLKEINS